MKVSIILLGLAGVALAKQGCSAEEMAIMDSKLATLKAAIELMLEMKQNNPNFDPYSEDVQELYVMMRPIVAAADEVEAPSRKSKKQLAKGQRKTELHDLTVLHELDGNLIPPIIQKRQKSDENYLKDYGY